MTNEKLSETNLDPTEIRRIWKNVAVIAVSFMVHFTATNAAINLQSSINAEAGLGTASIVALYTGNLLSNIFLTSVVIRNMMYGRSHNHCREVVGSHEQIVGGVPVICGALSVHSALFMTLLTWQPHAGDYYIMFIIAIFWGICNSVWMVQISTYHGVLFRGKEEAAYSNFQQWMGTGYIIASALSSYVRTLYKVYLIFSVLITGCLGYFTVEYRQHRIVFYSRTNTSPRPDHVE